MPFQVILSEWAYSGLLTDGVVLVLGVGSGGSVGTNTPLLHKIWHICPTMMKLGSYILPKEDPQNLIT